MEKIYKKLKSISLKTWVIACTGSLAISYIAHKSGLLKPFNPQIKKFKGGYYVCRDYQKDYKSLNNDYHQVFQDFKQSFMNHQFLSIHFDSPILTKPELCRTTLGVIVDSQEQAEEFIKINQQYRIEKLEQVDIASASIPLNGISMILSIQRQYVKLMKFLRDQGKNTENILTMSQWPMKGGDLECMFAFGDQAKNYLKINKIEKKI